MTVNKLTLPAKENAVQSKINEIIDNLGTSITVDQTYNGTSANPQSGVAIEGELSTNYQPKLVSGTNIKTINNTSLLGSGNIDTSEIFVAEYNVTRYSDISTAYNDGKAIYCKYTVSSLQTNYIPLAQFTGVEFVFCGTVSGDETLLTTCNQINIWHDKRSDKVTSISSSSTDMQYPSAKCVYDNLLHKADTTLSNVSSIDSNSAVQTALDGKVSKSGDTMTGNLTMYGIGYDPATNTMNDSIFLKSSTIDINTVPSGEYNQFSPHLQMLDKNGALLAQIFYRHGTNGTRRLSFGCLNGQDTNSSYAYIGFDADGNRVCSFPNTTCVDGKWVIKNVTLSTSSAVGTYNLTNTLKAKLPNDSYNYEILLAVNGRSTGSSQCILKTAYTSEEYVLWLTANSRSAGTFIILPVDTARTLTQKVSGTAFGAIEIKLQAYRRIGTNS